MHGVWTWRTASRGLLCSSWDFLRSCRLLPAYGGRQGQSAYHCWHAFAPVRVRTITISIFLSVREYISKTRRPNSAEFSMHVACGHGSVLLRQRCDTLRISVLWMTSRLPGKGKSDAHISVAYTQSNSPEGSIGAKSNVYDFLEEYVE